MFREKQADFRMWLHQPRELYRRIPILLRGGTESGAQSIFRLRHKGGSRGSGRKHEELRKPRLPGREAALLEALVAVIRSYFRK